MYLSMSIHHFAIYNAHKLRNQPQQILCVASSSRRVHKETERHSCGAITQFTAEVKLLLLPMALFSPYSSPYATVKQMYHLAGFE